jgi:hypothetical protein
MAVDVEWSLLELEKFIGLTVTDTRTTEVGRYRTRRGSQDDILAAAVVVEKTGRRGAVGSRHPAA